MLDSEHPDFAKAFAAMCETFGVEVTEGRLLGYWVGLEDLPLADVQTGIFKAIRQCKFMPKPAELRELAGELPPDSRAISAWVDVQRALPKGAYKSIDFEDKTINAVIRSLGGWPQFLSRLTTSKEIEFMRLQFVKAYRNLGYGITGEMSAPLPGLFGLSANSQVHLIQCTEPSRARIANIRQPLLQVAKAV